MPTWRVALIGIVFCGACAPDLDDLVDDLVDVDMVPAPDLDRLRAADLNPGLTWDHWVLLPTGYPYVPTVHGGQLPFDSLSDGMKSALLTSPLAVGFIVECLPGLCTWHFTALSGDSVRYWSTDADAQEFLSPIDTHAEAMLLARAAGYHFEATDARRRGIARAGDDFILLATDSQMCPRIDFRVALRMTPAGEATELGREVAYDFDSCVEI